MAGGKKGKVTPLMKQYGEMKAQHPDAVLLFRVGDFYEVFGEDAERSAGVLGITLTSRNNGGSDVALAGFPYHSLEVYLPKLVRAGFRVAVCEQLEKPSKERKIVRRGVTELVTPGVAQGDNLLEHKKNNFLAAIAPNRLGQFGISFVDISTGEFFVAEGSKSYLDKLLQGFSPSEVVLPKGHKKEWTATYGDSYYAYPLEDWIFEDAYGRGKLIEHFSVKNLKGFGIEDSPLQQGAAGAILHYLAQTQNTRLSHLDSIRRILPDHHVWLDRFTVRNLELIEPSHQGGISLVDVLDGTATPMGARLLRRWVVMPLTDMAAITTRHEVVEALHQKIDLTEDLLQDLRVIGDLERLVSKVATQRVNPREMRQLHRALSAVVPLSQKLQASANDALASMSAGLDDCPNFVALVDHSLQEEVPVLLSKGAVIASGVNAELDGWRDDVSNAQVLLNDLRTREAEATGITSLKVGFNNVFGYFLEVTNKYKNLGLIPDHWTRKQTLANAERYISEELKQLEERILGAGEKIQLREEELFHKLVADALPYVSRIQATAKAVAQLDCLWGFANLAKRQSWVRPSLHEGTELSLKQSRHPVIEALMPPGENYVPNDISLDPETNQILMITGPNMSGKSAILRQTALSVIMAQMGCFVAAESAEIGLVDKVFTRVGASDNISSGESTFMVEMNETASIMNNVSPRSLVLLDEIGRGTSTFDGVSIAWSIAEYLHEHGDARPKTLFATHYHELNALAKRLPRILNMHVATQEAGDRVIFLRKLVEGGSRHSFGIHVARMAGMPNAIVERAGEILKQLEQQRMEQGIGTEGEDVSSPSVSTSTITRPMQMNIFEAGDPKAAHLRAALEEIDVERLTPVEAMLLLIEWQKGLKS
ncbi:MAG: DNA mismatch repair protein MutS [Saprospiraceae bacterium]